MHYFPCAFACDCSSSHSRAAPCHAEVLRSISRFSRKRREIPRKLAMTGAGAPRERPGQAAIFVRPFDIRLTSDEFGLDQTSAEPITPGGRKRRYGVERHRRRSVSVSLRMDRAVRLTG